ncbi:MAG: hypothetical protein JWN03_6506 [Nocardia sp.]|nr:hypothetical protein [Nocardia sp.]
MGARYDVGSATAGPAATCSGPGAEQLIPVRRLASPHPVAAAGADPRPIAVVCELCVIATELHEPFQAMADVGLTG